MTNLEHCSAEAEGRVLTVTIRRPDKRNALSAAANHELGRVFDAFEADPQLWVAILTGEGDRSFCAGADLKDAAARVGSPVPSTGFAGLTARFGRCKPVIAAVNGTAMGGGFETALACDIVVASEAASFGLTEPRVGLAALSGGIQRLIREVGTKRANTLLLTGERLDARAAFDLGLVAEVAPPADLLDCANRWADRIMQCSPTSLAATLAVARDYDGGSVEASMDRMFDLPEVVRLFASTDAAEGPRAFAEKRKPNWSNPAGPVRNPLLQS